MACSTNNQRTSRQQLAKAACRLTCGLCASATSDTGLSSTLLSDTGSSTVACRLAPCNHHTCNQRVHIIKSQAARFCGKDGQGPELNDLHECHLACLAKQTVVSLRLQHAMQQRLKPLTSLDPNKTSCSKGQIVNLEQVYGHPGPCYQLQPSVQQTRPHHKPLPFCPIL